MSNVTGGELTVVVGASQGIGAVVARTLARENLNEIVQRVLDRIVPPIVERLVQERLDQLLKDQEDFVELKS